MLQKHGYPPNHKFKGKSNGGYNNNGNASFTGSFYANREVLAYEQTTKHMHQGVLPLAQPGTTLQGTTRISSHSNNLSGLSADQFEKLAYFFNNTYIIPFLQFGFWILELLVILFVILSVFLLLFLTCS